MVLEHTFPAHPHNDLGGVSSQRRSRFETATWSLATFVRSHHSLRSLAPQRSASFRLLRSLAPFMGSLTHFAHSLVLKFLNMCSRCYRVSREQTRFWSSPETRPLSFLWKSFARFLFLPLTISFLFFSNVFCHYQPFLMLRKEK